MPKFQRDQILEGMRDEAEAASLSRIINGGGGGGSGEREQAPGPIRPGIGANGIRPGMGSPGTNYGNIGNGNTAARRNTGNGGHPNGGPPPLGGITWAGNPIKDGQLFRTNPYQVRGGMTSGGQGTMFGGSASGAPGGNYMGGLLDGPSSSPKPQASSPNGFLPPGADPYDPKNIYRAYAEGGPVLGPETAAIDDVPAVITRDGKPVMPARIEEGEFVFDEASVEFYGLDKLFKMQQKAKESMKGMRPRKSPPAPSLGPQASASALPSFASGGLVKLAEHYRDPRNVALREQEARDANLATMGITDAGMGHRTLSNRYGTGFAAPGTQAEIAQPGVFANEGLQVTPTGKGGFAPVPDMVTSGPWASAGMWDDPQARRAEIARESAAMLKQAPERRGTDLERRINQVRPQYIQAGKDGPWLPKDDGLLPNVAKARAAEARLMLPPASSLQPQASSPSPRPLAEFETSWERRDREAAMREAMNPLAGLGLSKTQQRRFMQTPQGQRFVQDQIEQSTPDEWLPVPGTNHLQSLRTGQVLRRADAEAADALDPIALGMTPTRVSKDGVTFEKPKAQAAGDPSIHATKNVDGVQFNLLKDGTMVRAKIKDPTASQKRSTFKLVHDREPESADDWTEAYYLASGDERPGAATPSQPEAGAARVINTQAEYDALPKGARYTDSKGRTATKR